MSASGGGTIVMLGGKERRLRYDLNAIAEAGRVLGIRIRLGHLNEDLMEAALPLSAIRTIVWAGLLHAEPDLKEIEVGTWVDLANVAEVLGGFFGHFIGTPVLAEPASQPARAFDATGVASERAASLEDPALVATGATS